MTFNFTEISSTNILGNITIKTYVLDSGFQVKLEEHLKSKIKQIKPIANIDTLSNPKLKSKFLDSLKSSLSYKKIAHFDKRREYVSEFMAQTLLEKENDVIFFDEVDKKINVTPIEMPKSTDGIDVPGILLGDKCKFIVCEVKASDQDKDKVTSSTELLQEIKKASDNHNNRLLNELNDYFFRIGEMGGQQENIVNFLTQLIENIEQNDSTEEIISKNIIFIPFLIRKNRDDVKDFLEVVDYKTLHNKEMKGIIWGFNDNITNFCINIFDEALKEVAN